MPNKTLKSFFISTILFLLPNFVLATPSVGGVSGELIHNESIIVNGNGFGTKSSVSPLLWDSVDESYTGITNRGIVPLGEPYPWYGSSEGRDVHFKTTNPRGKWTAKYTNTDSSSAWGKAGLGNRNFPGANVLYVTWWMWGDGNACTDGNSSNKYTRFTDNGDWTENVQTVVWGVNHIDFFGVGAPECSTPWLDMCDTTGWHRMETTIDNTTIDPMPTVSLQVNNTAFGAQPLVSNCNLLRPITGIGVIGFDASVNPSGEPTIDWGEIYVDNTRARVEICNAATKAGSNHCEIQIPETTWIDNQLQIKVNQGSFADGSSAYLYVLDANGVANANGYPITFGSSSSDIIAPNAPSGLNVL